MSLIDLAIQKTREWRQFIYSTATGTDRPLTPREWRRSYYLALREDMHRGIREAVKTVTEPYKRTIAFQLLMRTLYDIFHYGGYMQTKQLMDAIINEYLGW